MAAHCPTTRSRSPIGVARKLGLALIAFTAILNLQSPVHAQDDERTIVIKGDRLSGFVLPIEPIQSDFRIKSLRAWGWTVDDTQRLLLEGDVHMTLGSYTFAATEAVVWINRLPSDAGVINQIAIYFNRVGDPTKQAGLGVGGDRLLVTASARGEVIINVALMESKTPQRKDIVLDGEDRLAAYLKSLLAEPPPPLGTRPALTAPPPSGEFIPVPGGTVPEPASVGPDRVRLPSQNRAAWLAGPTGQVSVSAKQIEISRGEDENIVTATGSLVVEVLADRNADARESLTLTAERAVIFLDPGPLASMESRFDAKNVRGVYLEGNVTVMTHSGEYFVRAPKAYYDFRTQQAIMVNSLLRVQPRDFRAPVYARAEEMRQLSDSQWKTNRVTVSASEFHNPHLAIGSQRAMITRRTPTEDSDSATVHVDSRGNTIELLGLPIFYWPHFSGEPQRLPLKNVQVGSRRHDGLRIETTWDVFALAGSEPPDGVEADLKLDGFTKRGAGGGVELRYDVAASEGTVDLYGLYDTGTDRTSSGKDVDPEDNFRGLVLWDNQTQLSQYWTLQTQLSVISDETFITSWREDDFRHRREFETAAYLKHQRDNVALTLLGKTSLQDFVSNSYLLASRAYTVDKEPELTYRRYGDSWFNDSVTYSTETRISRMAMVFTDATPNELGVPGGAFGLGDNDNIAAALYASGMNEDWYSRFDTRHELSLPWHPGIFNITPFVVGRFTAYDDEFSDFSSDADSSRIFASAGVRINTQFQRVYNNVESRTFDLHRMRHLIEPYLTLWASHASVEQQDLPVFDTEVESLANGTAVALGLRNTWQTQRGGPGNWRSVDWLMIDTSVVIDSEDVPNESPTPQYFDYRPEYSQFGDHVRAYGVWMLSDHLTVAGDTTYVLEDSQFARSSIGLEMRHNPALSTYIEYRNIETNDLDLLDMGFRYQLTTKYHVAFTPQWDLREDKFRAVSMRVTRSFPDFDLIFIVRYDDIRDDTFFGASLGLTQF